MTDVFISYKRDERAAIEQLASRLRALKLTVWFDASMSAGETFNDEIDREARGAKAVLVCWSPTARESRWVKSEAMIGFEQDKLAAVYVSGPDTFSPPAPFNTVHAEDLRAWFGAPSDSHTAWRSTLRRVGKLCGRRDIETWGALDAQATAAELRHWMSEHSDSPLRAATEGMLENREQEDAERARIEQAAREKREADRREAERRAQEDRLRQEADGQRFRERDHARSADGRRSRSGAPIFLLIGVVAILSLGGVVWFLSTQASDNAGMPRPERLAYVSPSDVLYLNSSMYPSEGDVNARITLTAQGILTERSDGIVAEHPFTNLPDPESCSFTPAANAFLTICRDIDWGPMFVGFLDPAVSAPLRNVLNPTGRGFHLPVACAPPVDYRAEGAEGCYARVDELGYLIIAASAGEVGSNALAVDIRRNRILWPDRSDDVPGVGRLRTRPEPASVGQFISIDNNYRREGFGTVAYTMNSELTSFVLRSNTLEVRGTARFGCDSAWGPSEGCHQLNPSDRSFETPASWYFAR